MFLGRFNHVLDEKYRLAIPARFRTGLGEGLVLTRGISRFLAIYPLSTWESMATRLDQMSEYDPNVRDMMYAAFTAAEPADLDKQGRIVVPERLRQYAKLVNNVAVVGVNNHIEVWDLAEWEKEEERVEANIPTIAARLAGQI